MDFLLSFNSQQSHQHINLKNSPTCTEYSAIYLGWFLSGKKLQVWKQKSAFLSGCAASPPVTCKQSSRVKCGHLTVSSKSLYLMDLLRMNILRTGDPSIRQFCTENPNWVRTTAFVLNIDISKLCLKQKPVDFAQSLNACMVCNDVYNAVLLSLWPILYRNLLVNTGLHELPLSYYFSFCLR